MLINKLLKVSCIIILLGLFIPNLVFGDWYNESWNYRQQINISNIAGNLTNYQVQLNLNNSNVKNNFDWTNNNSVRFTNSTGSILNFWITSWDFLENTSSIWVKTPFLENITNTTIFIYYGNIEASSESNYSETMTKNNNISSLVSEWHLDNGTGNIIIDSFGNNDGTFVNSPEWQGIDGGWWAGKNYVFDTGDHLHFTRNQVDYINVPDHNDLDFGIGDFSVSFWVKFNDLSSSNYHRILGKDSYSGGGAYTGFFFQWKKTDYKLQFSTRDTVGGQGTYHSSTNTFLNTSHYYHIIGVRNSNIIYLYVDNVSEGSSAESSPTNIDNSVGLKFGCMDEVPVSSSNLNGYLDEIKIYNKALNSRERESLFQRKKYSTIEPLIYFGDEETSTETTPPTSNHPTDKTYFLNSSHTIGWILQDETQSGNYNISRNGTTQNLSISWTNNTNLEVWVNTSTYGLWNYTIFFNDNAGNIGIPDTVFININDLIYYPTLPKRLYYYPERRFYYQ